MDRWLETMAEQLGYPGDDAGLVMLEGALRYTDRILCIDHVVPERSVIIHV